MTSKFLAFAPSPKHEGHSNVGSRFKFGVASMALALSFGAISTVGHAEPPVPKVGVPERPNVGVDVKTWWEELGWGTMSCLQKPDYLDPNRSIALITNKGPAGLEPYYVITLKKITTSGENKGKKDSINLLLAQNMHVGDSIAYSINSNDPFICSASYYFEHY